MGQICSYQLYILTVFYQVGTTIVFGFGATAGRDAWISAIISTVAGCLVIILYTSLMRMNLGLSLVQWWPEQFGKLLGTPIAWMYTLLMLYELGRGIGDLKFLIPVTILPKSSILIVLSLFMIIILYAVHSGIEVIARVGELVFFIIIFLIIMEVIFLYASKIMNFTKLLPISGKGWKPIFKAVWPVGITQSFGESIEFAMIWPLVKQPEKIMKATLFSVITSGVIIVCFDVLGVATLGGSIFKNSFYPLFTLVQQISVGEFITNLDALEVIFLLTNIFFKLTIHTFAIVMAIKQLTLVENRKIFMMPIVLISLYLGMTMSFNISEHIESGFNFIQYSLFVPFHLILPSILLVVTLIRGKYRREDV
ncbi:endospore germination permease [Clostridium sp.]|jgi:spore germination protein KB|uniref:GerAB/ArcD/ProY family transporter n=1 Tax=Clostridium sp. TaxID=1506 RepID=UPI00258B6242|nr:endospore germination permease [Clostridium sp.]MDF2504310.1 gerKB2 [Clostridium sp.]